MMQVLFWLTATRSSNSSMSRFNQVYDHSSPNYITATCFLFRTFLDMTNPFSCPTRLLRVASLGIICAFFILNSSRLFWSLSKSDCAMLHTTASVNCSSGKLFRNSVDSAHLTAFGVMFSHCCLHSMQITLTSLDKSTRG